MKLLEQREESVWSNRFGGSGLETTLKDIRWQSERVQIEKEKGKHQTITHLRPKEKAMAKELATGNGQSH